MHCICKKINSFQIDYMLFRSTVNKWKPWLHIAFSLSLLLPPGGVGGGRGLGWRGWVLLQWDWFQDKEYQTHQADYMSHLVLFFIWWVFVKSGLVMISLCLPYCDPQSLWAGLLCQPTIRGTRWLAAQDCTSLWTFLLRKTYFHGLVYSPVMNILMI